MNYYAVTRIILRSVWAQEHTAISYTLGFLFFAMQMAALFGDHGPFPRWKNTALRPMVSAVQWTGYICFGVMSLLVAYGMVADIIGVFLMMWYAQADINLWTLQGLLAAVALTVVIGLWQALRPVVKRVEVPLKNLPEAFDGFTIAQVSDLHVGPTIGREYAQKVTDIVNGLKPDAIALTGDFVDGSTEDLAEGVSPLAQLKAPDGVFFVTGNHEFYWDANAWALKFGELGARVLLNRHAVITRGGQSIVVAGVLDYSAGGQSNPIEALQGAPMETTKILLAHQPASYAAAHKAGFDLQLSGHAHGGQYFPFSLLIRFFQKYHQGLNLHDGMYVYVSNGTGYWGPPLRTFVPAEITLLTLKKS